ncbi:hypothetical protein BT63DRAFT_440475 [Microthyrium microscopicum]|uniref:Uncharacterized protein n=1 Tax=Microthyrium microscopicum TaxID=703497 RepID=A0A6A6U9K6_9PEZI|nr:hypothetical protein BT63DRAFT_440475 [Microthyrium microscopicum]
MLPEVLEGRLLHLTEKTSFLQNEIFCEWAYFINHENKEIKVWKSGKMLDKGIKFADFNEECIQRPQKIRKILARREVSYVRFEQDIVPQKLVVGDMTYWKV